MSCYCKKEKAVLPAPLSVVMRNLLRLADRPFQRSRTVNRVEAGLTQTVEGGFADLETHLAFDLLTHPSHIRRVSITLPLHHLKEVVMRRDLPPRKHVRLPGMGV